MKQPQDNRTTDLEDIFLWPCGSWCFRYEFEQMNHLSDDFIVIYFDTYEHQKFIDEYSA